MHQIHPNDALWLEQVKLREAEQRETNLQLRNIAIEANAKPVVSEPGKRQSSPRFIQYAKQLVFGVASSNLNAPAEG